MNSCRITSIINLHYYGALQVLTSLYPHHVTSSDDDVT